MDIHPNPDDQAWMDFPHNYPEAPRSRYNTADYENEAN